MPYFECGGCGRLVDLTTFERAERREHCPGCGETTTWTLAFEADEGVSF